MNETLAHTVTWKCIHATYHAETETASRNSTHEVMNTLTADLRFEATIMEGIHYYTNGPRKNLFDRKGD